MQLFIYNHAISNKMQFPVCTGRPLLWEIDQPLFHTVLLME